MRGFVWFVLGGIMALSVLAKDVPSASPKITNSPLVPHVWFTSSPAAHKLSYATPPPMKSASAFLSSFSGSPIAKQSGERLFASTASSWVSRTESVDVAVTVAENVIAHSETSSQHVAHLANIAVSRQTFDDRTSKMYSGLDGQYSSTMNVILKVPFLTLQSTTTMPSPNLLPFSSLPTTEPSILTVSFKKSSSIRSTDASLSSRALLNEETYIRLASGPSSILPHIRQDKPRQGSRNSGFFDEDLSTTYAQSSTPVVSYPVSRASVESLEYSAPEHRNKDISSFVVHDSTQLTTTIFSTTLLSSTPSTSTSSSPPFPPLSSMPSRPLPSSSRSPSHPPLSLLSSSPSISSSLPTSSSSPPSPSSISISSLSSLSSSSALPSPNSSLSLPQSPSPLPSKLESQSGIPTSLLLPSTSLSLFLSASPLSSLLSMPPLPSTSSSLAQSSLPSFTLLFPLSPLLSSSSTTMPSPLPLSSPSALQSSPLLTSSLSPSRSSSAPSSASPPPPPPLLSSSLFSLSSSSLVTSSSSSPPPSPKVQSLSSLLPSQLLTPSSLSSSLSLLPPKPQSSTPLPLSLPPITLLSPPQSSSPSSLPSAPSLSPLSSKSKSQSLSPPPTLPLLSSPTASSFSSAPLLSPLSISSSFSTPSSPRPPLPMSTQPPPLLPSSSSSSPSSSLTPSLLRTSPLLSPSSLPLSSHFSSSPPVPHLSSLPSSSSLNLLQSSSLPPPPSSPSSLPPPLILSPQSQSPSPPSTSSSPSSSLALKTSSLQSLLSDPFTMKSTLSPKAHLLSSSFTSSPSPSKLSTPAASSSLSSLSSLLPSSKTLQPQVSSSSSSSPSSPSLSSSSLSSSSSPSMPSVPVNSYVTYLETRFLKSTPASIFTSTDSSSGDHVVPSAFSSHLHQKETTTVIHITVPVELTTPKPTENQEQSTTRETPVDTKMWEASLKIENKEFNSNLAYNSSKAFKDLASDLEVLLRGILNQVPGFLNVKVDSFTKGSIICNFFIYTKAESTATTEEIENALIAASKRGETGNYNITDIHVKDNDKVDAIKDEKPSRENGFLPLKIIGGTVIAAALAMVIAFFLVKAIKKRRRRQREGYLKTRDVYPLNEFTSSKAEVEEKRPALKTRHMPDDEEAGDGDDEATPFYKPGYAQA